MKLLIGLILSLPILGFAQESRFLAKQTGTEKNQLNLSLAAAEYTAIYTPVYDWYSESYVSSEVTRKGNLASVTYNHSLGDLQQVTFGADLLLRQTQASGIRAFNAGYRGGSEFETATWTYGAHLVLSPGSTAVTDNVFRGYHTFTAMTGIESYAGPAALNAELFFESHLEAGNQKSYRGKNEGQALGLRASAEMPVYKKLTAGLGLGVSQSTSATDPIKMISGDSANGYTSRIFSTYPIDNESNVSLNIYNEKSAASIGEKTSLISLGYTQNL